MAKSSYKKQKRYVLRCCVNISSNGPVVTRGRRLFQKLVPEAGKAGLPTVESVI